MAMGNMAMEDKVMEAMEMKRKQRSRRIDLHMHILPGVDDGAETMEDAVEMAEISVRSGIGTVAATPHGDFSRWDAIEYIRLCSAKLDALRSELVRRKIPLKVVGGMELLVNEALIKWARENRLPGINGSRWLLVEFYFDISLSRALRMADELAALGYRLILAHPERYGLARRSPEDLRAFYDRNIILQVNKGSILQEFGRKAFRAADWMLSAGIAGAVASDAHDPVLRTPDMEDAADVLEMYYGRDAAEVLMERNPGRIVREGGT